MRQRKDEWSNLLIEIRLKWKEGTHKTFVKINEEENLTVPMFVTGTKSSFGNSTVAWMVDVMVVRHEREWTMWSIAPVSNIQELVLRMDLDLVCDANTEWDMLGV